jgi:hypothetical protein
MTVSGKSMQWFCPACPQMIITNGQQQSSLCCYIYIAIYGYMSRKKPIYCVFEYFSAALKKTNPQQSLSQEAIDEISKNNAG